VNWETYFIVNDQGRCVWHEAYIIRDEGLKTAYRLSPIISCVIEVNASHGVKVGQA
jgi:hypothetical protein